MLDAPDLWSSHNLAICFIYTVISHVYSIPMTNKRVNFKYNFPIILSSSAFHAFYVFCTVIYGLPKKGGQISVRHELMPDGGQLPKKPDYPAMLVTVIRILMINLDKLHVIKSVNSISVQNSEQFTLLFIIYYNLIYIINSTSPFIWSN